jgi:intron-binding protein aquarius
MELDGELKWRQLAEKTWLKPSSKARKVRPEVVKQEIWDTLESQSFDFRSLLVLENLQLLEKYLWPGYGEESSNYHVLLIALMVTVKRREGLAVWTIFTENPESFSSFFKRVLSMSVDRSQPIVLRNHILDFLIAAFQSLDNGLVRKECAPLVSISTWNHLSSQQARQARFDEHVQLRKAWRAAGRRYEAADAPQKARLEFERNWLLSIIMDFVEYLYDVTSASAATIGYCERFLELLTDLESQLPTRRYVNALLLDLNLLSLIKLSPLFRHGPNALLRDLYQLFKHFVLFPLNEHTGEQFTPEQVYERHSEELAKLQRVALKHFKAKLTMLALSNYGSLSQRTELESHLSPLSDAELVTFTDVLGFRSGYPTTTKVVPSRELLLEVLISRFERRKPFQEVVRELSVVPTELDLYEASLLRNESYDGSRSLAIPKLNLQYLTVGDFLWRSFILYRCESFFEVRRDIEDSIRRLQPKSIAGGTGVAFDGFSKMALPIAKPSMMEVAPAKVGTNEPGLVRAEIVLEVGKLSENLLLEWDNLKPGDVVYLLTTKPQDSNGMITNGDFDTNADDTPKAFQSLRTAEIVQVQDERGKPLRDHDHDANNGHGRRAHQRRLIVNFDTAVYAQDAESKEKGKPDVYETFNVIVRRKGRENNFKRILESIKSLTLSNAPVPTWLKDVFLGYGDPAGASYGQLSNKLSSLDFRDTFLDWQHLVESLPGWTIEPDDSEKGSFAPPYILEDGTQPAEPRPAKKRRREEKEPVHIQEKCVKVSTYKPLNNGPYVSKDQRKNPIRFTPAQVEAIKSGTQPGLTVIVGPPGTGKTDVATQIISNIYHDFPNQRTLLVAHSNQALNQLFQKITRLDIDGRHLLRLGHGEEDLETDTNYGKHGRVESFLDNRAWYLAEVDRLAANLEAPGAHGSSCETAGYFRSVYVAPAWAKYWANVEASSFDAETIRREFPFYPYFSNAPQPIFSPSASGEEIVDVARGCQRHIDKIFTELEDIRPFELLRHARDKANYLLVKEARIIAMTSTHAAMRRREIADLGFHYDNVIMEEAAQITEIENFIPFALQKPKDGELPLQRIVLCGDHLQNSPIVQNLAFRQFANLEQSLFLRLVRLGVPAITLDQQGRARPSIADLYRWRYAQLGDLSIVSSGVEYQKANAGFRYDYQFIDVPDYKGTGEMQPSPHFIQNLGEAEYAVAIYQYMRLLGYPASRISILTTYAGQRALIRDVLSHRCARNRLFGMPRIVTTVDKYQGEQNDRKSCPTLFLCIKLCCVESYA